jgi:2-polyprenyl-3-methyl-5-hydroxy-6-metoxy-1,4-benzoquinol methylase
LRDRLFCAQGEYNFYCCPNCGFVWLNPRPIQEDISECYKNYYTHQFIQVKGENAFRQLRQRVRLLILHARYGVPLGSCAKSAFLLGWVLSKIPSLRRRAAYIESIFPPWTGKGRLLDIGCGNGFFLSFMKKIGWQASGVEIDPESSRIAWEANKVPVFTGTLDKANFPGESFDAITMNHVIEHIANPFDLLNESYRILACGGYLCIATPNIQSLGHGIFGKYWLALDPPRHLYLWNCANLKQAVKKAGFHIVWCKASSLNVSVVFAQSEDIKINGRTDCKTAASFRLKLVGWLEAIMNLFTRCSGEEIWLLARKQIQR